MTTATNSAAPLAELEVYISEQLADPRNARVDMDPVLDIMLHAKRRIEKGDYAPRVISEAMISLDTYFLCTAEYETCAI